MKPSLTTHSCTAVAVAISISSRIIDMPQTNIESNVWYIVNSHIRKYMSAWCCNVTETNVLYFSFMDFRYRNFVIWWTVISVVYKRKQISIFNIELTE